DSFHEIFGQTFTCACGRTHHVACQQVIHTEEALNRVPAICAQYCPSRRVAVIMDVRTRQAAGRHVAAALVRAGWKVTEVVLEDPAEGGWPVCDNLTKDSLTKRVRDVDLIAAVGSGVISDLGKWSAFEANVPAVTVATAASMTGYASSNIAATIEGVKTLLRARPPVAVLSSPDILKNAPYELTAAGLGDVLARFVSATDWRLNHMLFGDYYCERAVGLVDEVEPLYFEHPADLKVRKDNTITALFEALLLMGVGMSLTETSAPASGAEHLISHTLDMMSSLDHRPHDLHGRQVGVGSILAGELYRRVLEVESPRLVEPSVAIDRRFWGDLADVVSRHFAEKVERLESAKKRLSEGNIWDRVREDLSNALRTPQQMHDCLAAAGAAYRAQDIGCDHARLLEAFLHGHEIRSRFTILDLAHAIGIMPGAASEIIDMWA
ncbi:MAG: iron-containing alcohol dehydrogenase, partial [Phycisphaerae bacterium]|nr:iron-containing alcohol dehydrogenase [Phycisphaerae bacterium]